MKYIVITSKHHDGFAMFDSKASQYNIVDARRSSATPQGAGRGLPEAGIRLGFYYSRRRTGTSRTARATIGTSARTTSTTRAPVGC